MAGRGFGSGFSGWRGGRGSGGFADDGGDFDNFAPHGSAKMWQPRGAFSGSGWGSGPRSPRRGGPPGGYGFGFRQDSYPARGRGGRNGGQNKLPSLLSHRVYPNSGPFQPQPGPQDFEWHFGGVRRPNRQRNRKKPLKDGQKKRKQSESASDEPDSKMGRTEAEEDKIFNDSGDEAGDTAGTDSGAEGKVLSVKEELALLRKKLQEKQASSKPENDGDQSEEPQEAGTSATTSQAEAEEPSGALSIEEELAQLKAKLQGKPVPTENKPKKIRGFFEMSGVKITARRISFACSVCKFRSFYSEDMTAHLESKFHKDIFKFLSNRLDKRTADFLQEYLNVKHKNMEKTISQIPNHEAAICQLYKERDMTRDIGMEHFIKKVEAAHCAVCDLYIPMQHSLIQRHVRSPDHNYNRKCMMEECKKSALTVARSILNHKPVRDKLEKYLKGENPFTGHQDDHDLDDSMVTEAAEADRAEDEHEEKEEEAARDESLPDGEASENQEKHEEHEEHEEEKPEAERTSEEGKEEEQEEIEGEQNVEGEEEEAVVAAAQVKEEEEEELQMTE